MRQRKMNKPWRIPTPVEEVITVASTTLLALLLIASATINLANSSPAPADIVALKTQQPFTLDGIPSEPFWGQIPATYLPLKGTTPYGGNVPNMWVKAANNGTYIFLLLQWPDAKESRKSDRALRLNTSTPGNLIGRYLANETYYYTDSATVTWWMGTAKPTVPPAANNEFGPSPTRRTTLFGWGTTDKAESWAWKSSTLDLGNPRWPDAGLDPGRTTWHWGDRAGQAYTMPYSSAYQSIFNATGAWTLGDGFLHAKACQQPGTMPFEVRARGVWGSGMWTLELARPFVSAAENRPYTLAFAEDKTYWTVFAAFDGNKGEWEEVASMSGWVSLEISKELVPLEKQAQTVQSAANKANETAQNALLMGYASIATGIVAIAVAVIAVVRKPKP